MSRLNFVRSILVLASAVATANLCNAQSVDVLYAQQNSTILTYTVDPATLQATQVGQPLTVAGVSAYVQLIPSPNDHFLYVLTAAQESEVTLSVYATNTSGVPQLPAVQTIGPESISQFTIDPNGKFAYMFQYSINSQGEYTFEMRLFTINGATGKLTESPQVQVKFSPSYYCGPGFQGFYPNGSQLNYSLRCAYPDSSSGVFLYRDVNSTTGQLGPAVKIFVFDDNDGGTSADSFLLSPQSFNNLHLLNSQTSMRIYPLAANLKASTINCTAAMLPACGQASQFWQDITGQYLVLSLYPNSEIVKVDLSQKQITDTGSSFSDLQQPYFSFDDLMMYGVYYQPGSDSTIQIYGFNPNTGGLTTGEQLAIPATLWNVFLAQRK